MVTETPNTENESNSNSGIYEKTGSVLGITLRFAGGFMLAYAGLMKMTGWDEAVKNAPLENVLAIVGVSAIAYLIGDRMTKRHIDRAIYQKLDSIEKMIKNVPETTNDSRIASIDQSLQSIADNLRLNNYRQ